MSMTRYSLLILFILVFFPCVPCIPWFIHGSFSPVVWRQDDPQGIQAAGRGRFSDRGGLGPRRPREVDPPWASVPTAPAEQLPEPAKPLQLPRHSDETDNECGEE